jgi:hypothetical protein
MQRIQQHVLFAADLCTQRRDLIPIQDKGGRISKCHCSDLGNGKPLGKLTFAIFVLCFIY